MSTKMQLTTRLDQQLVMSQQLRQAITLLQYNTVELKQIVQEFLETNPLIEVDENAILEHDKSNELHSSEEHHEDYYEQKHSFEFNKTYRTIADDSTIENYTVPKSLRDHLLEQTLLCKFDEVKQVIAEAIIDAIDENGLLTMAIEDIKEMLDVNDYLDLSIIEEVLQSVQTFDPIGIAARDVKECLLIQLTHLPERNKTWELAYEIINHHFDLVATNYSKKIIKKMGIEQIEYTQAMEMIRLLDPKPGLKYSNEMIINVEPELYVKKIKNTWKVFLTDSLLTNIKINRQYQEIIKQSKSHKSYESLKKELQEAQWLLKGLSKRNETLLSVANYIVKFQKEFLDHGLALMKPMNIIDVSSALNIHESTVSRITTGKYISTPWGVLELKFFFPSYVSMKTGENCSDTTVKEYIKEIINRESIEQVYSDEDIATLLKEKGINIARRTVAKYREAMKILPSYQRAQMQLNR